MSKIAAMAAVTGALALAPAFALAGDDGTGQGAGGAKSKIVIKSLKATGASGKVTSKENKCEKDRRVQFFRLDDFISVKIDKTAPTRRQLALEEGPQARHLLRQGRLRLRLPLRRLQVREAASSSVNSLSRDARAGSGRSGLNADGGTHDSRSRRRPARSPRSR